MRRPATLTASVLLAAPLLLSTGCRISSSDKGDNNNVRIATPFGGLQVKTNDAAQQASVGLPTYPGAEPTKKQGSDDTAADINMSFGSFQMRVKALNFRTSDDPAKVQAFYKDALRRYGNVIECVDDHPVGTPDRTTEGLTCNSKSKDAHVVVAETNPHKLEFKAGSEKHQHIVSIEHDGAGTRFALVALDLPGSFTIGTDDTNSESTQ